MTHPLEQFDHIFIINLASRSDRRREMADQLRRIGLDLPSERISIFDAVRPADAGDFPTLGARGCYLSHLGVLKEAHRRGLNRVLVWEDDLDFTDDFVTSLEGMREGLDREDWSMFYGTYAAPDGIPEGASPLRRADSNTHLVNAQFLAYQGSTIKACGDYLELILSRPAGHPEGGPMHVDGALNWFRRVHPERITLLAVPQLGYERPSRTDIHELRWYDRVPVLRSAVDSVRKLKPRKFA